MDYKGINYDIGTKTLKGKITREVFDAAMVAKEIAIIKNELHCNAIRISGLDIERIGIASEAALKLGLTVLFSPALHYDNRENTLQYILKGAEAAEKLRRQYPNIIYVTGCELTMFTAGFVKGQTGMERIGSIFSPFSMVKNLLGIPRTYNKRLNSFLSGSVTEIRKTFKGQITYASGTWEKVDWDLFDMIGIDHYLSAFNKAIYAREIQKYKQVGKPLLITEFGCCAYKGAQDKGAMGWAIVDWDKNRPQLKGDYTRDERVQANYLTDCLGIFKNEKVDGAFAFTFATYNYIQADNPQFDIDMASYGVVKMLPEDKQPGYEGMSWARKEAFFTLGELYKK